MFDKAETILKQDLEKLIDGCLAGDRSCQKKLYDLYSERMLGLCLRYSNNREEAEEILQDGFLQMFRNIKQYRQHGAFEGWVRKIMINCALMRYRAKTGLSRVIPLHDARDHLAMSDDFVDRLGERELVTLVQQLPPGYRMVFNLYVFEGMKHKEIAVMLGISEGTSKSNLSDARGILRKALSENCKVAK